MDCTTKSRPIGRKYRVSHVTQHLSAGLNILAVPLIQQMYRDALASAQLRYGVVLTAFCFMPNHVHLILKYGNPGQLSKFMMSVNSAFAGNVRRSSFGRDLKGKPLFSDRPSYVPVRSFLQLGSELRYLHNNPSKWNADLRIPNLHVVYPANTYEGCFDSYLEGKSSDRTFDRNVICSMMHTSPRGLLSLLNTDDEVFIAEMRNLEERIGKEEIESMLFNPEFPDDPEIAAEMPQFPKFGG